MNCDLMGVDILLIMMTKVWVWAVLMGSKQCGSEKCYGAVYLKIIQRINIMYM